MLGIAHVKYVHFESHATQIENLLTLASPSHMKDEVFAANSTSCVLLQQSYLELNRIGDFQYSVEYE